jgi:PhzF family phenazine biosynthesis protein
MSKTTMTEVPLNFRQVDVFTSERFRGNGLAVVANADDLSDQHMQMIARWTNLAETTFLLRPTRPDADYRVRIFSPDQELSFAGHPTLGSCSVWLGLGHSAKGSHVVQECAVGLVPIKRTGRRYAFAAPPLRRSGAVAPAILDRVMSSFGITHERVAASAWVDNGPGWIALLLRDREELLALRRDVTKFPDFPVGLAAPCEVVADGTAVQFEVRAFIAGRDVEDPVTGGFNAGLAHWLINAGLAPTSYVAQQGTVLGRRGFIHVERSGEDIWIGGDVVSCIEGTIQV